ncbi:MAG TPA: molecular chaperone HtpG [Burkholderiaceae bacterium]|nr:molecular chaperone HtpG [Burkholderiaceae bacterium]
MGAMKETLGFQTEVKQLLQLMIHSLYSNREIFLRELVSNASDACDKLRFEAIDRPELYEGDGELAIRIEHDEAARTITVSDNGIGLSRQEAIDNLGTIARSGTREFFASLTGDRAKDANLIGQFGVGFYSSFIVADRVVVESRRAGLPASEGVRWESDGSGEFSVEPLERAERGTRITLHLREKRADDDDATDHGELLSGWRLRSIVRKYSDHISLPIRMRKEAAGEGDAVEWETVNQASALWARSKSELDDAQYKDFYKHLTGDFDAPLAWTHNRVEGRSEYTQLLYVPARAPFDLWDRQHRRGIRLYVRRVFIMDDAEQLMPVYLRFVKGVVDSADLPLNVSREILQESRDVRAIREGCTKRVLSMLEDLAENRPDDYAGFWREFGQVLKEGLGEDFANQERLSKLLRFASTATAAGEQTVSLAQYVARMKPGQDKIYYVTAETEAAARNSPHLEVFRRKEVEVLVLADRVDEWMLSFLQEFDGKPLVSVARGGLDLGALQDAEEKRKVEETAKRYEALVGRVKASLGELVKDVRVTDRLVDSPCCLVSDEGEISGTLQRLLKQAGQKAPERRPILEINPAHPLVERMNEEGDATEGWARLLYDQALLAEGGQLEDPAGFVKRLNGMLLAMAPK